MGPELQFSSVFSDPAWVISTSLALISISQYPIIAILSLYRSSLADGRIGDGTNFYFHQF